MTKLIHKSIHAFPDKYFDLYNTLKTGGTISEWVSLVEMYAKSLIDENEEIQTESRNKFRGDMLEVLAEIFFTLHQCDERFGVKDYTPVPLNEDYGVDATGINPEGNKIAIQVKYRGNLTDAIDYTDLAKTTVSALLHYNVQVKEQDSVIFLFTTCSGANHVAKGQLGKKLVVINRNMISRVVDNNVNFWGHAFNMIFDTLN